MVMHRQRRSTVPFTRPVCVVINARSSGYTKRKDVELTFAACASGPAILHWRSATVLTLHTVLFVLVLCPVSFGNIAK